MKTRKGMALFLAILMIVTNIVTLGAGANEAPAQDNAAEYQTLGTQIAPITARADGRQRSRCGADARLAQRQPAQRRDQRYSPGL